MKSSIHITLILEVWGLFMLLTLNAFGQRLPTDSLAQLGEPPRRTDLPTNPIPVAVSNKSLLCNRAAIIADYTTNYLGSAVSLSELGWTGNVTGCVSGSISALSQSRVLQRINYYRRLVGVTDNTTFDPSQNTATQDAALIMKANNALSHTPPSTSLCYTAAGYTGASKSNLGIGSHSSNKVKSYMDDFGANNTPVGHRRWILYSRQASFGHGSTDFSDALWVLNPFVTPASVPAFVAFPPAGYVPRPLIPGRWSFSIPNADFTNCIVTLYYEGFRPVALTQHPVVNGYGDNTVVWDFDNPGTDLAWNGTTDIAFDVRVSGVEIDGETQPDYTYRVVAIDPTAPSLTLETINPTCGSTLNNGSVTANFDRGATSFLWSNGNGLPGATTQTLSDLGPGSYTVTVTDKNDCPYSQTTVLNNTTAHVPIITSSSTTVCAGNVVSLTASNCRGMLTWSDGLGTGNTKSVRPAQTTTYSVTCAETACISSTAAITVSVSGPKPALCSVSATNGLSYYYGVERFMFNTIDATSGSSRDDGANYINRACDFSTTVTAGQRHSAFIKSYQSYYGYSQQCRVYIDFNNNGLFTDPGETVLSGLGTELMATVLIPATAVQNTPLRVRVVADDPDAAVSPCLLPGWVNYGSGQAEDYSIVVVAANGLPAGLALTNWPTTPFCYPRTVTIPVSATGTFGAANQFRVLLSDATGSFAAATTIGTGTSVPLSATLPASLSPTGSYRVRVVSTDPALVSNDSPVLNLTPLPTATLTGSQTITAGQAATLTVALTGQSPWTLQLQAIPYDPSNGFYYFTTSSPLSLTVSPTVTTTTYTVIRVLNIACGRFAQSSSATVTVANGTANCSLPASYTARAFAPTAAVFTWSEVVGATYEIRWRINGSTIWNNVAVGSVLSHVLNGLTTNQTYEWQMRVVCFDGQTSAFSPSGYFYPTCSEPATLPETNLTQTGVQLNWNLFTTFNIGYYVVWRVAGGTLNQSPLINTNATSYTLTGLTPNTTYQWQLYAYCSPTLTSNGSTIRSFTTSGACTIMTTLKAGNWTDPTVWSCNRIPIATDAVDIRHAVTVPAGTVANARRLVCGMAGKVVFGGGARLLLNP